MNKISDVAANVSVAYKDDIWQNDMIFKDQDDCSKRLICELNTRRSSGTSLSDTETIIADAFGSSNELDVAQLSLPFDIAAVLGREVNHSRIREAGSLKNFNPCKLLSLCDLISEPTTIR